MSQTSSLKRSLAEPEQPESGRQLKVQRLHLQQQEITISKAEAAPACKFQVFISHRGPDTKTTLAYHIYDLLRHRGVEAFLDKEELETGQNFPDAIQDAIAVTTVDVCIISNGYAQSFWCLKELEMMIDKHEKGTCVLIPVFYDVDPSDVRRLKGTFGQGFLKHTGRYDEETLQKWRNALQKLADINGFQGKGDVCMDIVKRICQELDVGYISTPAEIVGMQEKLLKIKNAIMIGRQESLAVASVEISGIGGIGKTTFAKLLYNAIYSHFDRHCFIEDVNGIIEKNGITAVQKNLMVKLFGYCPDNDFSVMDGKQMLMRKLHNAKICVVLDNIDWKNCLSEIFIENDASLSPNSTIIVTSREKGVLKFDNRVARYCQNLISLEISKLSFDESKEVFCNNAFGKGVSVQGEFEDLVSKFVHKCDGIPLALQIYGRQVYRRERTFWEEFWNAVQFILPSDLKEFLKPSYNRLNQLEQRLFLDVAIFLRGENVDLLKKIREDPDKCQVSIALDKLEAKLFVDTKDGYLHMHDVLVDLGRSIVEDENLCPGRRSRLWHASDVRNILSNEWGSEKVEGLSLVTGGSAVLDEDDYGDSCPWSADALEAMPSLEFLILDGDCIQGDFSKISKRLLWLKWTHFPHESIPPALCIRHVRVLDLSQGKQSRLWEPRGKEAPTNLRELNLQDCRQLQRLPEFTAKFRQLSFLQLVGCEALELIPNSFGLLQGLKCLHLKQCNALELLPDSFGDLRKLLELRVSSCSKLKSLPRTFGKLPQIQRLVLEDCMNLEIAENSFGDVSTLQEVGIQHCKLLNLPSQVSQQSHLKWLEVADANTNCSVSDFLFPEKSQSHTPEIHQLDEDILYVPEISYLRLRGLQVTKFREPVGTLNVSSSLRELHLHDCWYLEQLPKCIGNLAHLETLHLRGCLTLTELPQSIGNLASLQCLRLEFCLNLQELPESIGKLSHLDELHIENCWNLPELPAAIGNLENLTWLEIENCPVLKGFPASLSRLSNLTELTVSDCWMVEAIDTSDMSNLESLELARCINLKSIDGLSGLNNVHSISIDGCLNLQIMSGFPSFQNLRCVHIQGCWQLAFPDDLVDQLNEADELERMHLSLNDFFLQRRDDMHFVEKLQEVSEEKQYLVHTFNAKVNASVFPGVRERVTDLNNDQSNSLFCTNLRALDGPELTITDTGGGVFSTVIVCFLSAVTVEEFPKDIPPPETVYTFQFQGHDLGELSFRQYGCGQEIHFGILSTPGSFLKAERGQLKIDITKTSYYPCYEALLKDGCLVFLRNDEKRQDTIMQVTDIFYSELKSKHTVLDNTTLHGKTEGMMKWKLQELEMLRDRSGI